MADSKNNTSFWKSLKDYYQDPAVLKAKTNEFMDGVTDDFDPDELNKVSRRKFLALMTASAAFTATACSDYRDKGEIVPYNDRPDGVLPGKPNYYASTCNGCDTGCGVLVKTREGRPIKLDGNPDHPVNAGKICTTGQASIIDLYDPDRLTDPLRDRRKVKWQTVDGYMPEAFDKYSAENKEIAFVTENLNSPAFRKLMDDFKVKYPVAKVYTYQAFDELNRKEAWNKSYGNYNVPSVKWGQADIIVSLDADILGNEGGSVEISRHFAKRREAISGNLDFNRLYVVEGALTLTGANADYRIRIRPDKQFEFAALLLNQIASRTGASVPGGLTSGKSVKSFEEENNIKSGRVSLLVNDLIANKGKSIVYAGREQSVDIHIIVNMINEILGNTALYDYNSYFVHNEADGSIDELISNMQSGKTGAVVHIDVNPVYHLSGSGKYEQALEKVPLKVAFAISRNETTEKCNFILPIHHYLESWGDYSSRSNIYSLRQPVINPIFDTRQAEAAILNWLNPGKQFTHDNYHVYLKDSFKENVYSVSGSSADFEKYWFSALHDGIVEIKTQQSEGAFNPGAANGIKNVKSGDGYVLQVRKSYFVGDGKSANNGWLHETPHPVSKVTWDNYAAVSPATSEKLGVVNDDVIEIAVNGAKVKFPVLVQPGTAENTIVTEAGYGRTVIGDVGKDVGVNAYLLGAAKLFTDVKVNKTGETYALASTQEHHAVDDPKLKDMHRSRDIIQDGTVDEYKKDPKFLKHHEHNVFSITDNVEYKGVKWAMAIDLNKCTSCSACVTSCNVENNIPVVGKDQVSRGREMQWIRVDRYYSGSPEEPVVSNQPMLCQHCDNAPCENVCPVNATNHSPDGLNQMAYNRCVGTRYCANNCPFKVRRFNFYNFRDHFADSYYENELSYLASNPEVTVRSRGVMEKCTFCIQKIMDAREVAIRENRDLKGDDVVTACQQACPTNAIVFGDSNDPESTVSKYREHNLGYHVLENLNVRPNVTYIAKLRNTHSEEA